MKTHQNCLLCGDTDLQNVPTYAFAYLKKCSSCGFVFSERIPTYEELTTHYDTYSRDDSISPITLKRYVELLDYFKKITNLNRIIDVGCGNGHFLKVAKDLGFETHGTEFTDKAIELCEAKGIQMQKGVLNPENYDQRFDLITSFEVIEHINNPHGEVDNFHKILRKGGLVYVTTPNFDSISKHILKENWTIVEYPEHLSYYTPKTIQQLFEQHDFKTLKIETTGVSLSRYQQGQAQGNTNTTAKDTSSQSIQKFKSSDENLRQKSETNPFFKFAKQTVNFGLNTFKIGDSLKGVFQKK